MSSPVLVCTYRAAPVPSQVPALELRIKDITERLWSIELPKHRFNGVLSIHAGEIIRIRNVMTDLTNRRNILTVRADTNVLKFLPSAKIVGHMAKEIKDITD